MIFNLFKSKPTLKELIPNGFIDIHSHILPGIDDGAKNIEDSIKLITEMKELGFKKIIATPHTYPGLYENDTESIKYSYQKLIKNLEFDIIIKFASEYFADETIFNKVEEKKLLCLKDNYVLIETSFMLMPAFFFDLIFFLRINDYIPVIAHPERYNFLSDDIKICKKLKKMGCKFQINLLSTTGYYGPKVTSFTNHLIEESMIDYVGSDIHNIYQIKKFDTKVKINNLRGLVKAIENNLYFK